MWDEEDETEQEGANDELRIRQPTRFLPKEDLCRMAWGDRERSFKGIGSGTIRIAVLLIASPQAV